MSKLDELLQGVDVEWRVFGDIASIKRGASPRPIAKFITDDENGVPWIKIGDTSPNSKYVENTLQKITAEGSKKSRLLKKGDFIISNSMSFGRPYILNIDGAIHDGWASVSDFSHTLSADYLYHYLSSSIVQNYWISKINSGSVSNLNADIIKSLQIPIPCPDNPEKSFEIQQEIVRVLDELTTLTNQLTTELESERQNRKKQFEFFREQLFRFEEGEIQIKPLIEIAEIGTGSRNTNEAVIDGQYPFFVRSQIPRAINEFEFDETAIITAGDGVGVGKVFHYISGKYALHQRAYRIVLKSNILSSKYLFYYIKNNFSKYIEKISVHASVTSLRKPMFEKYPIPIPPLAEQERIVKLLDQFDATHTAIEEEITKEIKLRTQQYEYYREKLLSFPQN
ncbi:restriction endonuclease subunit S [Empedobacter falsenii]